MRLPREPVEPPPARGLRHGVSQDHPPLLRYRALQLLHVGVQRGRENAVPTAPRLQRGPGDAAGLVGRREHEEEHT